MLAPSPSGSPTLSPSASASTSSSPPPLPLPPLSLSTIPQIYIIIPEKNIYKIAAIIITILQL